MKIGELSRKCGVSRDTIRYYIDLKLLLPSKEGAQINFTQRDYEDLCYIQELKQMHFNLKEILSLFSLKRMTSLNDPKSARAYLDLLLDKQKELKQEEAALKEARKKLSQEIQAYSHLQNRTARPTGVPVKALSLLSCPHCHSSLEIQDAQITGKYIMKGKLTCSCGYQALIQDGILLTGNEYTGGHDRPDLDRGLYRNVGDDFAACFRKAGDWMTNALTCQAPHDKVIMETNINGYFFLYYTLEQIPRNNLYIITDRFPQMLSMYKALIEQYDDDLDILYLADDQNDFPILPESVDILIDFFGSNEHFLYKKVSYLEYYYDFLKKDGKILGALFGFPEHSHSLSLISTYYPECSPIALNVGRMLDAGKNVGLQVTSQLIGTVTHTFNEYSFACQQDGEELQVYTYTAKMSS